MIRRLICQTCAPNHQLLQADLEMGSHERQVHVSLAQPGASHGVTINGQFAQSQCFVCDICNKPMNNQIAVAFTHWKGEGAPRVWETEYGQIIPPQSARVIGALTKK